FTLLPPHLTIFPTRRLSDLCSWQSTARATTSTRDSHFSDNCPPACPERIDCSRISSRWGNERTESEGGRRPPGAVERARRSRSTDRKSTRLNSSHQIISYAV